jgi:hypothetical protein
VVVVVQTQRRGGLGGVEVAGDCGGCVRKDMRRRAREGGKGREGKKEKGEEETTHRLVFIYTQRGTIIAYHAWWWRIRNAADNRIVNRQ